MSTEQVPDGTYLLGSVDWISSDGDTKVSRRGWQVGGWAH